MRVALLGGTGFVGAWLTDALLDAGHEPSLLVRRGSEAKVRQPRRCRVVTGEVTDAGRTRELLAQAEAVIYNIGILRETRDATFEEMHWRGVERTIAAARDAGCRHFILMSANGAAPDGTAYQATKFRGEEAVAGSGLKYTILRPSVIFGDPRGRDEIASRLYRQVIRPPLPAPWFYTGLVPNPDTVRLSPVAVADVADAFVAALADPGCRGRRLELGGARTLSWKALLECIATAVGRRKIMLPLPLGLMAAAAAVGEHVPGFPVTREQLRMLASGNTAGPEPLAKLIGREPAGFNPDLLGYLRR